MKAAEAQRGRLSPYVLTAACPDTACRSTPVPVSSSEVGKRDSASTERKLSEGSVVSTATGGTAAGKADRRSRGGEGGGEGGEGNTVGGVSRPNSPNRKGAKKGRASGILASSSAASSRSSRKVYDGASSGKVRLFTIA